MLKKLSLAALVAMGSMSVESASTDLSEAIKGVTIGGYLRYRYTEDNTKTDGSSNHKNTTTNEYKAVLNMNVKASDTMTVHSRFVYLDSFTSNNTSKTDNANPFNVQEAYLQYAANGVAVKAGRQALATPLSDHDDDYANGVLATYTTAGVTGAAGYFTNISNASNNGTDVSNNLEVLAVIANIDPVKAQAWFYNVDNSNGETQSDGKDGYKAYFVDVTGAVSGVALKAQYAAKNPNVKEDTADSTKTQKFFALAAIANVANVNATAAYLNFGKNGATVAVGTKNADGLIAAGDILTDKIQQNTTNDADEPLLADGSAYALVLKTKVGQFTPGVQYVHATTKTMTNTTTGARTKIKFNEYDLDLSYAYNKKLSFSGYYAILKSDYDVANSDQTQTEARFEAKYSF